MDSPQSEAKRKQDIPANIEEGSVRPPPESSLFPIVGIGASAGGLEALRQLLPNLPRDTGLAFVVVQHLRPHHQSMLPELLSRATTIPVLEAKEGMRVEPDHVYVTPPNAEITIRNGVLSLRARHDTPPFHLPIDGFFTSLAEDRKDKALGVVLSGTASDGTLGLKAIKAQGGITFAQEEQSAKFGGMPHSAIYAGHVDFVLPPEGIARELGRIGQHLNGSIGKEPAPEDLLRLARPANSISFLLCCETKPESISASTKRAPLAVASGGAWW